MNAKSTALSTLTNRKVQIFILFLVLSSLIWLLIELSKSYTSSVNFKIEYNQIPTDKLFETKPVDEIKLAVKSPGFSLLKYKIRTKKIALNLSNLSVDGERYYILPNQQLSYLTSQLSGGVEIVEVFKDTIFLYLGKNISKKVKLKPNVDLSFKHGYNLASDITIDPDSVLISGPKKLIDSINQIETVSKQLINVFENQSVNVGLVLPLNENFEASAKQVLYSANIDKFTEGKIEIPVTLINVPENIKVNPFPKQIELIYTVGLSNFNNITSNSFKVVFDYKQYEKDTLIQFLEPTILYQSNLISTLKLNPSKVEFLIKQK
jgi:hypothetical protein